MQLIKFFLYIIGKFLGFLSFPSFNRCFTYYYSGVLSRKFKKVGKSLYIKRSINQLVGPKYISLGNNVTIGRLVTLTAWNLSKELPEIIIGDNTTIGDFCHITAVNGIYIGSNVLFGKWATITDNSHGDTNVEFLECDIPPLQRKMYSKGKVYIEDNVWIGDKVTICAGVRIGEGSIVGANSVVTHDVPPYSIVAGVPAKLKKKNNL